MTESIPKVISGFPGVGKTTMICKFSKCVYLDIVEFMDEEFPKAYMDKIRSLLSSDLDYIIVSSHDVVRASLRGAGIPYTLIYPSIALKSEYIKRYKDRGDTKQFIELMDKDWNSLIVSCAEDFTQSKLVLKSGQYLFDII